MNGPIPDVGIEGPCPRRPDCDAGGEASLRNQKNWNGGESGEEAVDRKQNPGRGSGRCAPSQSRSRSYLLRGGYGIGERLQWRRLAEETTATPSTEQIGEGLESSVVPSRGSLSGLIKSAAQALWVGTFGTGLESI